MGTLWEYSGTALDQHGNSIGISWEQSENTLEMQWEYCTSMIKLKENVDEVKGYSGIWECSFHHNYAGHYVNIICLEVAREY